MAKTFNSPGDVGEFTAPAGGVVAGTPYLIGTLLVVAQGSAAVGEKFIGAVTGVHDLAKVSAQAWTEGQLIYWDNTAKLMTNVATSNTRVGTAWVAAANPSATGSVKLNGVGAPSGVA